MSWRDSPGSTAPLPGTRPRVTAGTSRLFSFPWLLAQQSKGYRGRNSPWSASLARGTTGSLRSTGDVTDTGRWAEVRPVETAGAAPRNTASNDRTVRSHKVRITPVISEMIRRWPSMESSRNSASPAQKSGSRILTVLPINIGKDASALIAMQHVTPSRLVQQKNRPVAGLRLPRMLTSPPEWVPVAAGLAMGTAGLTANTLPGLWQVRQRQTPVGDPAVTEVICSSDVTSCLFN